MKTRWGTPVRRQKEKELADLEAQLAINKNKDYTDDNEKFDKVTKLVLLAGSLKQQIKEQKAFIKQAITPPARPAYDSSALLLSQFPVLPEATHTPEFASLTSSSTMGEKDQQLALFQLDKPATTAFPFTAAQTTTH